MMVGELPGDKVELTSLLLNILVDGVMIYDRTCRLGGLVAKAREFAKTFNPVRYRIPDGERLGLVRRP
jgi:hypothetical protein